MNNKKCRGSLAIKPGRTGILRYRPLDRDLAVQIGSAQVLIVRVDSGSSGPGRKGERPAAGVAGDGASAAEGSPETPKPALWGSIRPGLGSGSMPAERVVHLDTKVGTGEV